MNDRHPLEGYTNIIYGLHALAGLMGVTSSATVVGSFVFGIPSIAAVVMNYLRRGAVRGTWLESHFRWQIRTFWGAAGVALALGASIAALWILGFVSFLSAPSTGAPGIAGAGAAFLGAWLATTVGALIAGIWILYRVMRGWLALREARPLYV